MYAAIRISGKQVVHWIDRGNITTESERRRERGGGDGDKICVRKRLGPRIRSNCSASDLDVLYELKGRGEGQGSSGKQLARPGLRDVALTEL